MPKNSVCGVRLATWGTHEGGGNGMLDYIDKKLFGGNVGHAALSITFPANDETKEWIKKYCLDPTIPFEKHKIVTKQAEMNEHGKYEQSDIVIFEEEVYVVNFSWFPKEGGFALSTNLNEDGRNERRGVNRVWAPHFKEYIQPEQRYHQGLMGKQLMTYGASNIIHERNLTSEQSRYLKVDYKIGMVTSEKESLQVLEEKIDDRIKQNKRIKERREALANRQDAINKQVFKVSDIKQLRKDIIKNEFNLANYSDRQQEFYKELLGSKWRLFSSEMATNGEKRQLLTKIKSSYIEERIKLKEIEEDTLQKLKDLIKKNNRLSQTEILLLDRLIPDWHEKISYNPHVPLTTKQNRQLKKMVHEQSIAKQIKLDKLRKVEKKLKGNITEGLEKELIDVRKVITIKEKQLNHVEEQIKYKPQSDELHVEAFYLRHEIDNLKKKETELKSADVNKYNALQQGELTDWESVVERLDAMLDPKADHFADNDIIDIPIELAKDLDDAFEHLVNKNVRKAKRGQERKKSDWRSNFVYEKEGTFDKISQEEAIALRDWAKGKLLEAKTKAVDMQPARTALFQSDFENFSTVGAPPDNVVHMRINQAGAFEEGLEHGLDVESMLQEIQHITTEGKKFNLEFNNCAVTVGRILEAGADGTYLKSNFQNKALGAIGNPQMIYNNARKYNDATKDPNDSLLKRASRMEPLAKAGGWCVNTLVLDDQASVSKKVAAGVAAVPVGLAAGLVTGVTKLVHPLESFNGLGKFFDYAKSRPSAPLKVAAVAMAAPVAATLAVPAAVAFGVDRAVSKSKTFLKSKPEVDGNDFQNLEGEKIEKGESIEAEIKQKVQGSTTTIHADSLEEALAEFEKALEDTIGPVALDKHTQRIVNKALTNTRDPELRVSFAKRYADLCMRSTERVNDIQKEIVNIYADRKQKAEGKEEVEQEDEIIVLSKEGQKVDHREPVIKIKDAVLEQKEQYFSVMPLLGEELAKQIPSYFGYRQPEVKHLDSKVPRTVNEADLRAHDGYIASIAERDHIIQMFKADLNLKELKFGTPIQLEHSLSEHRLSCGAFKDEHENIYLINNPELGRGNFGVAKVIQAIDVPNPNGPIQEGGFYVVKLQNIHNDENPIDRIREEMGINTIFGLHFGGLESQHLELKEPPVYVFASEYDQAIKQTKGKQTEKEEESMQNEEVPQNGTFFLKASEEKKGLDIRKFNLGGRLVFTPNQITLDELIASQPDVTHVSPSKQLSGLNMLEYLIMFEKMTAEVDKVHNEGILHRDIKAENFLYDPETKKMKIIDFGLSKYAKDPNLSSPAKMAEGSPSNMPPEMYQTDYKDKISTKQDIYGLSRTFELLMYHTLNEYHAEAFKLQLPSPNVPFNQRADRLHPHLQNFRFENDLNDPHVKCINDTLELLHSMKSLDVNARPEASVVKAKIRTIIRDYHQSMELEMDDFSQEQAVEISFGAESLDSKGKDEISSDSDVTEAMPLDDKVEPPVSLEKNPSEQSLPQSPSVLNLVKHFESLQDDPSKKPNDVAALNANLVRQKIAAYEALIQKNQNGGDVNPNLNETKKEEKRHGKPLLFRSIGGKTTMNQDIAAKQSGPSEAAEKDRNSNSTKPN